MTEKIHICPDCNSQMFQKFNSTIWVCFECKKRNKPIRAGQMNVSAKKEPKKGLKFKKTKSPKNCAMDTADKWFSWYIRLRYSQEVMFGVFICHCYTCGNRHDIKIIENGHYHGRENKATRYHENNARPQCTHCNQYKHGKHTQFGNKLLTEIGNDEFEELRKLALSVGEDNEMFYREQAKKYRLKFNQLLKERKISNPWTK